MDLRRARLDQMNPALPKFEKYRNKIEGENHAQNQNGTWNRSRKVVSQRVVSARKKLLLKEKKFSKLRDELNLERRKLPWVKVEKDYVFEGRRKGVVCGFVWRKKSAHYLSLYVRTGLEGWLPHCSFWATIMIV